MPASLRTEAVIVLMYGSTAGKKTCTHRDTALVELEEGTPAEIAVRIEGAVTLQERQQRQQGIPAAWATRIARCRRSHVYKVPVSGDVSADYIERARPIVRARLAQAGARFAWLRNETTLS
jgi:hypothetical protein